MQINFNQNYNGKLFLDNFGELIPKSDVHYNGAEFQAWHKSIFLGVIKIEAVRSFPFGQITDVIAFINCGQPAHFQAAVLKKLYAQETLFPDSLLDHIVFSYVSRNIEAQGNLLDDWWRVKKLTYSDDN